MDWPWSTNYEVIDLTGDGVGEEDGTHVSTDQRPLAIASSSGRPGVEDEEISNGRPFVRSTVQSKPTTSPRPQKALEMPSSSKSVDTSPSSLLAQKSTAGIVAPQAKSVKTTPKRPVSSRAAFTPTPRTPSRVTKPSTPASTPSQYRRAALIGAANVSLSDLIEGDGTYLRSSGEKASETRVYPPTPSKTLSVRKKHTSAAKRQAHTPSKERPLLHPPSVPTHALDQPVSEHILTSASTFISTVTPSSLFSPPPPPPPSTTPSTPHSAPWTPWKPSEYAWLATHIDATVPLAPIAQHLGKSVAETSAVLFATVLRPLCDAAEAARRADDGVAHVRSVWNECGAVRRVWAAGVEGGVTGRLSRIEGRMVCVLVGGEEEGEDGFLAEGERRLVRMPVGALSEEDMVYLNEVLVEGDWERVMRARDGGEGGGGGNGGMDEFDVV